MIQKPLIEKLGEICIMLYGYNNFFKRYLI